MVDISFCLIWLWKLRICCFIIFIVLCCLQDTLSTLFSLYIRYLGTGTDTIDTFWLGRQGIALTLHSAADVFNAKDLPVVMTFLISRALVSSLSFPLIVLLSSVCPVFWNHILPPIFVPNICTSMLHVCIQKTFGKYCV